MFQYCLINEGNCVVNVLAYDEKPTNLSLCDCRLIENTANAGIGWMYENGTFIKPDENPNPPELPSFPVDPKDKMIEDMKADILKLTGSLTQVIQHLNQMNK
jgi:hypothetical protein